MTLEEELEEHLEAVMEDAQEELDQLDRQKKRREQVKREQPARAAPVNFEAEHAEDAGAKAAKVGDDTAKPSPAPKAHVREPSGSRQQARQDLSRRYPRSPER